MLFAAIVVLRGEHARRDHHRRRRHAGMRRRGLGGRALLAAGLYLVAGSGCLERLTTCNLHRIGATKKVRYHSRFLRVILAQGPC